MQRRDFLATTLAAASASLPLSGLSQTVHAPAVNTLSEPARDIPVVDAFDVIVCGAGPAGVAAAIEAGRTGAKTLLLEVHGCLGGVWTSGCLTWNDRPIYAGQDE